MELDSFDKHRKTSPPIENVKFLIGSISGTWNVREIQMLTPDRDEKIVMNELDWSSLLFLAKTFFISSEEG